MTDGPDPTLEEFRLLQAELVGRASILLELIRSSAPPRDDQDEPIKVGTVPQLPPLPVIDEDE